MAGVYLGYFLWSFGVAVVFTILVKRLAERLGIIDYPDEVRKIHGEPTALLGGLAIFGAFFVTTILARDYLLTGALLPRHLWGVLVGAIFLMIGGFLDDKYNLKPKQQFIWPILAALSVVLGGVEISKINTLAGGFWHPGIIISSVLVILWLLGMMYTTKLLDGVDGLVSGLGMISALVIFLFTTTFRYYQFDMALAAFILAAVLLGFLFLNFYKAKIFLGEGGSLLVGYLLGVLAIISGAKIAIALLVMGIPILDVFWTIIRRLFSGQNPFKIADNKHLHHRLLALGLSQRQTVSVFYVFSLVFGLLGLFLQSRGKIMALLVLGLIMFGAVIIFSLLDKKKDETTG